MSAKNSTGPCHGHNNCSIVANTDVVSNCTAKLMLYNQPWILLPKSTLLQYPSSTPKNSPSCMSCLRRSFSRFQLSPKVTNFIISLGGSLNSGIDQADKLHVSSASHKWAVSRHCCLYWNLSTDLLYCPIMCSPSLSFLLRLFPVLSINLPYNLEV